LSYKSKLITGRVQKISKDGVTHRPSQAITRGILAIKICLRTKGYSDSYNTCARVRAPAARPPARTHARTHARMHACTHARMHTQRRIYY